MQETTSPSTTQFRRRIEAHQKSTPGCRAPAVGTKGPSTETSSHQAVSVAGPLTWAVAGEQPLSPSAPPGSAPS